MASLVRLDKGIMVHSLKETGPESSIF